MFVRRVKIRKKAKYRTDKKTPHQKRNGIAMRRKRKRYRAYEEGTCVIKGGTITWTLPRKVKSLNKLRGWRARHGDTKGWEDEINNAKILSNDMSLGPSSGRRLRLEVIRLAPNQRFRLDRVNLYGGLKGLEDALVRLNFLVDDSDVWEDGPHASQALSPDKKYWTIIKLMEAKPEPPLVIVDL